MYSTHMADIFSPALSTIYGDIYSNVLQNAHQRCIQLFPGLRVPVLTASKHLLRASL